MSVCEVEGPRTALKEIRTASSDWFLSVTMRNHPRHWFSKFSHFVWFFVYELQDKSSVKSIGRGGSVSRGSIGSVSSYAMGCQRVVKTPLMDRSAGVSDGTRVFFFSRAASEETAGEPSSGVNE